MKKQLITVSILILVVLFFVGITRTDDTNENIPSENSIDSVVIIPNQGGVMEGHTPRGFAGTGTGLFVGDNLNPSFPEGDGVQMFLTFDLSGVSDAEITSVYLQSNSKNTEIQGTPFKDLGNLIVEGVLYDEFSANLWDSESLGVVCILEEQNGGEYGCDVSSFMQDTVVSDNEKVQFRIRFEKAGDGDGKPDMLFFYNTNSNTNESGLFELNISTKNTEIDTGTEKTDSITDIQIPVVAYLVKNSGEVSTQRNRESLESLFENSQNIWNQAGIVLDVSIEEIVLDKKLIDAIVSGEFRDLYSILPSDNRTINIFYVSDLLGPNGIALAPTVALVADITTVDDFRATAHEIGHLLGLTHTQNSQSRLMFPGANGRELSGDEISLVRNSVVFFDKP